MAMAKLANDQLVVMKLRYSVRNLKLYPPRWNGFAGKLVIELYHAVRHTNGLWNSSDRFGIHYG